jgi:hypothetical protein
VQHDAEENEVSTSLTENYLLGSANARYQVNQTFFGSFLQKNCDGFFINIQGIHFAILSNNSRRRNSEKAFSTTNVNEDRTFLHAYFRQYCLRILPFSPFFFVVVKPFVMMQPAAPGKSLLFLYITAFTPEELIKNHADRKH